MNMLDRRLTCIVSLTLVLTASVAWTGQDESLMDPRAEEILREMSSLLAKTSSFAFKAEQTFDEILESGLKVQFSNYGTAAVVRPNRAAAHVDGDLSSRTFWYDGRTVAIVDERHLSYVQVDVPDTIDGALDFLAEEYDVVMPLADFLSEDVFGALTEGADYATYLGIHRVGETMCHHIALANDWLEWQIWVDAENEPLPRKFLINYMDEPGEPQFTAFFRSWNLSPELPKELFQFEVPDGAVRMEAKSLKSLMGPDAAGAEVKK